MALIWPSGWQAGTSSEPPVSTATTRPHWESVDRGRLRARSRPRPCFRHCLTTSEAAFLSCTPNAAAIDAGGCRQDRPKAWREAGVADHRYRGGSWSAGADRYRSLVRLAPGYTADDRCSSAYRPDDRDYLVTSWAGPMKRRSFGVAPPRRPSAAFRTG